MGATLIAASVVLLIIGTAWLGRVGEGGDDDLQPPMVDGVTLPVDDDGDPIEIPPSQPATAVSFTPDGQILRPDPVRARIVDEEGDEVLVALPPDTTVDTVTGEIVPRPGGSSTTGSDTTRTTRPSTTPTTRPTTTTDPPPTTTTTDPPPTTTTTDPPPTTTTTEPPPTTTEPPPPTESAGLFGVLTLGLTGRLRARAPATRVVRPSGGRRRPGASRASAR